MHAAFIKAFPAFKDDPSWIYIATILYGEESYKDVLIPAALRRNEDDTAEDDSEEENEDSDGIKSLSEHLESWAPDDEDDMAMIFRTQVGTGDPIITWLKGLVEDDLILSEEEAKEELNKFSKQEYKILQKILSERIPPTKRGQASKVNIILWLMSPNATRSYIFYKSEILKEMLKEKNLKPAGTRVSDFVHCLGQGVSTSTSVPRASTPNLDPTSAAIQCILENTFQKRQKGKAREYCSIGHRLEKPILKSFLKASKHHSSFSVDNLRVHSAYTAGLAGKKGKPVAKDSIDFHLHVINEDGALEHWGFEAKGRVTVNTATSEENYLRDNTRDTHICIPDVLMHKNLTFPSERYQLLHHAYVYDYPKVVHAAGNSNGVIIHSTIVEFSVTTKFHYDKIINDLHEITLKPLYDAERSPVPIPDGFKEVEQHVKTINGFDTLQGRVNLWKEISRLPHPLPPIKRIIPSMHAYWNATKSGSDTTTMLMDACIVLMPKPHVTSESVAVTRLISIMFVLVHRLNHLFGSKGRYHDYPSLSHYRNNGSQRSTFHQTILTARQIFLQKLEAIADEENRISQSTGATYHSPAPQNRRGPSRQRMNGVVLESVNKIQPSMPFATPVKLPSILRKGSAPTPYRAMDHECSGIPIKRWRSDGKPANERCSYCSIAKTAWYCVGCKQYLCLEKQEKKDKDYADTANFGLTSIATKGDSRTFQLNCFHRKHMAKWERNNEIVCSIINPNARDRS